MLFRSREIVALTKLETAWFMLGSKRVRLLAARVDGGTVGGAVGDTVAGTVMRTDADGVTVACGDGAVTLLTVQPEGKTAMSAAAWANGARLPSSLA